MQIAEIIIMLAVSRWGRGWSGFEFLSFRDGGVEDGGGSAVGDVGSAGGAVAS